MYNHLPKVDSTRSFEGSHRSPRSEAAELRRMHREHVAAERARNAEQTPDAPVSGGRGFARPVAALLGLVATRR